MNPKTIEAHALLAARDGEIYLVVHSGNVSKLTPAEAEDLRKALADAAVVVERLARWLGP